MSSYYALDEARTRTTKLEIGGNSRTQAGTQRLQSVMNTSVVHDPEVNSILLSNSTNLTNNYAPLEKVIIDTNFKRNTHPLASYLNDIPFYDDAFYNNTHISALAKAHGQAILDSKFKNGKIELDMPRLNAQSSKYDDKTLTQTDYSEKRNRDANGFPTSIRTRQANEAALKDVMYASSHLVKGGSKNINVANAYTAKNSSNTNAANELISDEERAEMTLEAKAKESYNRKTSTPLRIKATSSSKLSSDIASKQMETFTRENDDDSYLDQIYIQSLESRIIAVIHYVLNNESYSKWKSNWEALDKTLKKRDFNFSRLICSDADIAYTVNKGEMTRFRIRDNDRKYVPLNIYQYVLFHECAHIANFNNWGHGADFQRLLSLLCLAAYELGLIRLKTMTKTVYLSNGQPIVCQRDMKNEILHGINEVVSANPSLKAHYIAMMKHIEAQ